MAPVVVRGAAAVGGFGAGTEALLAALARPPLAGSAVTTSVSPGHVVRRPAYAVDLAPLTSEVDPRHLRRVDRFGQMAILGARLALADAGLLDHDPTRIGVALATGYGANATTFAFFHECLRGGDAAASPTLFSKSGHSSAQSSLTILLGLEGPCLTICQPDLAVVPALTAAIAWLTDERVDAVLVGGIDEIFDLRVYTRERLFGAANDGPMRPLDLDRQSSVIGEGAFFVALTRGGRSPDPGLPLLERVRWDHLERRRPDFAGHDATLVSAAGNQRCGHAYASALPPDATVLAYSPLIGAVPVSLLFNLVVAATFLRRGQVVPLPVADASRDLGPGFATTAPRSLACLDCRGTGRFGQVDLRLP